MKFKSILFLATLSFMISPLPSMDNTPSPQERLQNKAQIKNSLIDIFSSFIQKDIPANQIKPDQVNEMLQLSVGNTISGPEMFDLLSEIATSKEYQESRLREEINAFLQAQDLIGTSGNLEANPPKDMLPSQESGEPSQQDVEEKVNQIATTQFHITSKVLPPEMLIAILVQLEPHELVIASEVSQAWREVALLIMDDNLYKLGITVPQNPTAEQILKLYQQVAVSKYQGTLLEDTEGGRLGFIVQVTVSNDPNVPVGTKLYLHPHTHIWNEHPPKAGQTVFFNKVTARPIHNPFGGDPLKLINEVKGFQKPQ